MKKKENITWAFATFRDAILLSRSFATQYGDTRENTPPQLLIDYWHGSWLGIGDELHSGVSNISSDLSAYPLVNKHRSGEPTIRR